MPLTTGTQISGGRVPDRAQDGAEVRKEPEAVAGKGLAPGEEEDQPFITGIVKKKLDPFH